MTNETRELEVIAATPQPTKAAQAPALFEMRAVPLLALKNRRSAILELMKEMMQDGTHYGTIPGTNQKSLLKPGAELACSLFGLSPEYLVDVTEYAGGHREYRIRTRLMSGDHLVAEGVGSCSTMEAKYGYRKGARTCPSCGTEGTIIKGKKEYGGGWLCWKKNGGCDAKFNDNDPAIISQQVDRIPNPDLPDQYNTVLKMAKKRSLSDATITATGVSDIFTQDMAEEADDSDRPAATAPRQPAPKQAAPVQRQQEPDRPEPTGVLDKQPSSPGDIKWETFKYRYHLPYKREGYDMEKVRADFKKAGFRFNADDKHWYGNKSSSDWSAYLRPLYPWPLEEERPEEKPSIDEVRAESHPDDFDVPTWDTDDDIPY